MYPLTETTFSWFLENKRGICNSSEFHRYRFERRIRNTCRTIERLRERKQQKGGTRKIRVKNEGETDTNNSKCSIIFSSFKRNICVYIYMKERTKRREKNGIQGKESERNSKRGKSLSSSRSLSFSPRKESRARRSKSLILSFIDR